VLCLYTGVWPRPWRCICAQVDSTVTCAAPVHRCVAEQWGCTGTRGHCCYTCTHNIGCSLDRGAATVHMCTPSADLWSCCAWTVESLHAVSFYLSRGAVPVSTHSYPPLHLCNCSSSMHRLLVLCIVLYLYTVEWCYNPVMLQYLYTGV
jgi:hypothetical protein